MIRTFQSELKKYRPWQILKKELLKDMFPQMTIHSTKLGYYDLILVLVNESGEPIAISENTEDTKSYMAFTQASLLNRISDAYSETQIINEDFDDLCLAEHQLSTFMVGDLIQYTHTSSRHYKNDQYGIIVEVVPVLPAWLSAGYMYKIQFATRVSVMKSDYFKVIKSIDLKK